MLLTGNASLANLITTLSVLLVAMTIHEFAHVYIALLAGDPTATDQGRLTLNPFVHINWIGFLMFALIGFGFLGSAPVNPNRMRNPRWGYLAAVAAGPVSNLLLAGLVALPVRLGLLPAAFPILSRLLPSLAEIVGALIFWNVLLFVFNMLPFFPIDGWTVVRMLLPAPARYTWEEHRMTSQFVLMALIFLPFVIPRLNVLGLIIFNPARAIIRLLIGS